MTAPRAPLARRFGKSVILRLDQALGRIDETLSPRLPVPALSAERRLIEPVMATQDIEGLVLFLAGSLKTALERRGEGARTLQLILFRVDGTVTRLLVGTVRPVREPQWIARLFHERLSRIEGGLDAGYGFDLVRLAVLSSTPLNASQSDLVDEGHEVDAAADLVRFVDRVCARLGRTAVLRQAAVASHVPERAVAAFPFGDSCPAIHAHDDEKAARLVLPAERPIRLLRRPEPVEVVSGVPEGPLLHFRWRRAAYRIARTEGPERISPEWWMQDIPEVEGKEGEDTEEARQRAAFSEMLLSTRDYFRIEDTDGRRFWLYRQGDYGMAKETPRWFLHGLFA